MENFIAYNPTKVHFGKDVVKKLGNTVSQYGKNVLLIYGKGSILGNGIYNEVKEQLKNSNVFEYKGIKPNPIIEDVDAAIEIARKNSVDCIVAVGGGSVIDTAKIVSLSAQHGFKGWDVMLQHVKPTKTIPLLAVLTVAATGTEMNGNAVIQNNTTKQKLGLYHPHAYPAHSFLDPQFTFTVSKQQTANGIVDMIAHALEAYFGKGNAPLSDRFVESIIADVIQHAPKLLSELNNYDLRAYIMWDATCALNGITLYGREGGDWGVHHLAHELSLLYDLAHGATLSITYPAWMKFHKNKLKDKMNQLGSRVFQTTSAEEMIEATEKHFEKFGCPIRLQQAGIDTQKRDEIVETMNRNKATGIYHTLTNQDREKLVDLMFSDVVYKFNMV